MRARSDIASLNALVGLANRAGNDACLFASLPVAYYRAQRRLNRYWCEPERNARLRDYLAGAAAPEGMPCPPAADIQADEREQAEDTSLSTPQESAVFTHLHPDG